MSSTSGKRRFDARCTCAVLGKFGFPGLETCADVWIQNDFIVGGDDQRDVCWELTDVCELGCIARM